MTGKGVAPARGRATSAARAMKPPPRRRRAAHGRGAVPGATLQLAGHRLAPGSGQRHDAGRKAFFYTYTSRATPRWRSSAISISRRRGSSSIPLRLDAPGRNKPRPPPGPGRRCRHGRKAGHHHRQRALPRVYMCLARAAGANHDFPAAQLLAGVLGGRQASRLYRSLVVGARWPARSDRAGPLTLGSLLRVAVTAQKDKRRGAVCHHRSPSSGGSPVSRLPEREVQRATFSTDIARRSKRRSGGRFFRS